MRSASSWPYLLNNTIIRRNRGNCTPHIIEQLHFMQPHGFPTSSIRNTLADYVSGYFYCWWWLSPHWYHTTSFSFLFTIIRQNAAKSSSSALVTYPHTHTLHCNFFGILNICCFYKYFEFSIYYYRVDTTITSTTTLHEYLYIGFVVSFTATLRCFFNTTIRLRLSHASHKDFNASSVILCLALAAFQDCDWFRFHL